MAQRLLRSLTSSIFRRDVSREVQTPELCLELAKECLKQAQRMTSPGNSSLVHFNHGQCEYLANELKWAVFRAEICFPYLRAHMPTQETAENSSFEIMRLVWRSAKEVESFIQRCCTENWISAAMELTNMTEHVSQLGSSLSFYTYLLKGGNGEIFKTYQRALTLSEVLTNFESHILINFQVVKEVVSKDQSALLVKLETVSSSSNEESQLVKCLSGRLNHHLLLSVDPLSAWEIKFSSLTRLQSLGNGSFGIVCKSVFLGVEVAEKMFYGSDHPSFRNEVEILAGLAHPNIVPMLGYATDGSRCSIVMELMDGDLRFLIEEKLLQNNKPGCKSPFVDIEAVDLMLQTGQGMLYLHENRIVHRDLKAQNILVKSRKDGDTKYLYAKVADFGLSKTKEKSSSYSNLTSNIGTTRWMAPELMLMQDDLQATHVPELKYPFKVDVYSFGMVCYELLTGQVPFSNSSPREVRKMVLNGDRPKLPDQCPSVLKGLIHSCWQAEASSRPSFMEVCKQLRYLKYKLIRTGGALSTFFGDVIIGSDPEAFEAIRELTNNFRGLKGINGSLSMFQANLADRLVVVKKLEQIGYSVKKALLDARLNHKNVLNVIGCSLQSEEMAIAYEYAALGSLHNILHGEVRDQNAPVLPWVQRIKVAVGVARGLEFLHKQNITHGNIKASKILIFDDYVPKIGDFISNTTKMNVPLIHEARQRDIYDFGVLLLELLTGKQLQNNHEELMLIRGKITPQGIDYSIVDHRISSNYSAEGAAKMEALAVAALCYMTSVELHIITGSRTSTDFVFGTNIHILIEGLQLSLIPKGS